MKAQLYTTRKISRLTFFKYLFLCALFSTSIGKVYAVETTLCPIYPLGISETTVKSAVHGQLLENIPTSVNTGNFSWLTWAGSPDAPTLANSLLPPGNSHTYINPNDEMDIIPEIGDWVMGSPGVNGSRLVKQNLGALLGKDIIVPVWTSTEGNGNNLQYQVSNFIIISLSAFRLDGQGWISFEYKGDARCYNDAPIVEDDDLTTNEDVSVNFSLKYFDPEGDKVAFKLVEPPQNGVLSGSYPDLIYTPSNNFNGDDSFTYTVNDGQFDSNLAAVIIHVLPVNDAPIAFGQQYLINEDETLVFELQGQDIDSDTLSFSIVSDAGSGTLILSGSQATYVPKANFTGDDQFTFVVNDGELDSNIAQINITANPVNDAPLAVAGSYEIFNDQVLSAILMGQDVDGDTLNYTIVEPPEFGIIDGVLPNITYTPNAGYEGEDSFTFVVNDGGLGSLPATISILVKESNKPPQIVTPPITNVDQDQIYNYLVEATDPNVNDSLTYELTTSPAGMTINTATGLIDWNPDDAFLTGSTDANQYCSVPIFSEVPRAADIVVAIDSSGSMSGETNWIKDLIPSLNDSLEENDVGVTSDLNRYGLVSYLAAPTTYQVGNGLMGSPEEFINTPNIPISGGTEDGYRALKYILDNYPLRDGAATNLILVTDEDRDNTDGAITYNTLRADIQAKNALLNVVVNNSFYCEDGSRALGIDSTGLGYLVDGQGGFITCQNARVGNGSGSTERDYVDLALSLKGAAWDLSFLRQGGLVAESFSKALVEIKVREVINQLSIPQSDLVVSNIELEKFDTLTEVKVTVLNRGLSAQSEETTLYLYDGDETGKLLAQATFSDLEAGASQIFTFNLAQVVTSTSLTASITPLSELTECERTNNSATVPVIEVQVTDSGGLTDDQIYTLWVKETNTPPQILSTPSTNVVANDEYSYLTIAQDDNIGDVFRFSLIERPSGMAINSQTGELTWQSAEQYVGEQTVTIRATDLAGAYDEQTFILNVVPGNQRPSIISTPLTTAVVGDVYSYDVNAIDGDLDVLNYQLSESPLGMSIDSSSGAILWEPTVDQLGPQILVVRVEDENGGLITQSFVVQVSEENGGANNQPPFISSSPVISVLSGGLYQYQVVANDPEGGSLVYNLLQYPEGMAIDTVGTVNWQTPLGLSGSYAVVVQVSDKLGLATQQSFSISVDLSSLNTPPIINSVPSTIGNIGKDYEYQITASDTDGDSLIFMLLNGPNGMQLSASNILQWIPQQDGNYPVQVSVSDGNGASVTQSFSIGVGVQGNLPPQIESEPSSIAYADVIYGYQVNATDPEGDLVSYELLSSPNGANISPSGAISWTPSFVGIYGFSLKVSDTQGGYATQIFEIQVLDLNNTAPVITSLPPTVSALLDNYVYQVIAEDTDNDSLSYLLLDAPAGMTIDGQGLINWLVAAGSHTVSVQVSDSRGGTTQQSFTIAVSDPNNHTPIFVSVPQYTATLGQLYQYLLVASDEDNDALSYSLQSSPNGMVLDASNTLLWTPANDQITQHTVVVDVSDGRGNTVIQEYTIAVSDGSSNQIPEIISSPIHNVKLIAEYQYQLVANDPDSDPLTYELIQGPVGSTIDSNTGLISWTPSQLGDETFSIRATDGLAYATQVWSVHVLGQFAELAVLISVSPTTPIIGDTVTMSIVPYDFVGAVSVVATLDGTSLSLDQNYEASMEFNSIGSHIIEAQVTDNTGTNTETKSFIITDPSDFSAPTVTLKSPSDLKKITGPEDIIADVNDENLALWQLMIKGANEQSYTVIAEGTQNVTDTVITTFDPSLYVNGLYNLVLQAVDYGGNTTFDSISIRVTGDQKVGNFSFTVTDLDIPVSGIPIQVNRTYDSRRRNEDLDFGYGWSIDYQNVKLEESRVPGKKWALNTYRSGPFNAYATFCVEPLGDPLVTVTLPSGEVETFKVQVANACHLFQAVIDVQLEFEPTDGSLSTLEQTDYGLLRLVNGDLIDWNNFTAANPTNYLLTTKTGFKYELNQSFGIKKVIDPNGNTLTYTDDGIFHSDGKSVQFQRDAEGQISTITDPSGNTISYQRNASGDLLTTTDQLEAPSTYAYNNNHGLVDMFDPLGRKVLKNIYDDDGRLIAQEDSDGNRIDFNHDIAGRESVVTNRLGHKKFFYYDDKGNVTSTVDALGGVNSFTFDANDNQLSKTDALNRVTSATYNTNEDQLSQTDALGQTVNFTYNDKGQELVITDESGDIFTNVYDTVGNLLSITDPHGITVGNNINSKGLPILLRDGLGNETHYTYDEEGNKLTETNALGQVTTYTYDDNGNTLSQSISRTLADSSIATETTSYVFDKRNRVISTTNVLGQTHTVEFDLVGNQIATVDSAGTSAENRTEYTYDVYGRNTLTNYADGTTTSKTYDKEGNVLSETNRLGNSTTFEYDALNRLITTTYADATTTQTQYDAVGQVIAEIDASGNTTSYAYDLAGRRITSTDALDNVHQFTYDVDGNLKTETDALNHTTTYVYDSLDRKTQTIMHNNSLIKTGFDALSRRTSSTDQAAIITNYGYDALGRLTRVTDIEGNVTSNIFDEAGNKLTQTDAKNRTTQWSYDALGRVLTRTLPLGQVEVFTYDDSGNMITRADFNGEVTTYSYDVNNRVTNISYAKDSSTESYTYDAAGNRLTSTNSQGAWVYTYNKLNRLSSETKPSGDKLSYGYDANGNKTQLTVTYANGDVRVENSTYDGLNRLSTVNDADGNKTTYTYDAVGNRATVTHSNANITSYVYDELNRLTQMQDKQADNTVIQQFDYTLDITGRRTKLTELSGRESSYSYDSLYRLTTEAITDVANGNYSASYTFDLVGNRTQSIINGITTAFTYDDNDRLSQTGGETYTYDANGSTLTKILDNDSTTYTYDAKNKLTTASVNENDVITEFSYQYNVDGIRTEKVADGVSTNFLIDNNQPYAQVIAEIDASDIVKVEYVFGDDLLTQKRNAITSNYLYDGLGSTRILADATGNITDEYFYDAFGVTLATDGTTENDYLYTGEQFDAGLDNYYLRARYYDSGVGRFTQQDTYMGNSQDPVTLHKYLYANADPVSYTDPTGKFSLISSMSSVNIAGTLAVISYSTYQIGQSLADGGNDSGGYNALQLGWLTVAGMSPAGAIVRDLINAKIDERDDSNDVIDLYRSVENGELASLYSLNKFSPGRSAFPKQFFHSAYEASAYANKPFTIKQANVDNSSLHLVSATISKRLYNNLDHEAYEPGIGPIVTVNHPMLPAFNFDMKRNGGWQYISTF